MTSERLAELERLLQIGAWLNREQAMEIVAEVRRCWAALPALADQERIAEAGL